MFIDFVQVGDSVYTLQTAPVSGVEPFRVDHEAEVIDLNDDLPARQQLSAVGQAVSYAWKSRPRRSRAAAASAVPVVGAVD